jgi:hypothetical protein
VYVCAHVRVCVIVRARMKFVVRRRIYSGHAVVCGVTFTVYVCVL